MSNQNSSSGSIKMEPDLALEHARNDQNPDYHETDDLDIHYNKALDRDIRLMEAYRQMPILYDRDHPDFRYVNKKEKAWKELSKRTGMSLENCRKRVTYIRARFTVERRTIRNGQLNSDWPLMEKLKFLHKHVQIRRLRGTDDNEPDGDFEEEPQNNPSSTSYYNPHNPTILGHHPGQKRQSDEDDDLRTSKRRQSVEELEPIRSMTPYRHQNMFVPIPEVKTPDICINGGFPKRDENVIFGEYVAEVLKKLPRCVQPQTTLKIMQVLVDAQEANMAATNDSTTDHNHQ